MRGPRVGFQTFFKMGVRESRRSPRPKRRAAAAFDGKRLQILTIFPCRPPPPAAVRDATDAYMDAEDAIATWLSECCCRDPDGWESSTALFGSWTIWARHAGETVGSQRSFIQNLEKGRGLTPKRNTEARGFCGVRLNSTAPAYEHGDAE